MARTAQISKEERPFIITLRHEGQSIRHISRTLKVSSSADTKTIKRYDETGSHEDRHRKGRPRVTSVAEDTFIRVTSLRIGQLTVPQIAPHRVKVIDTSQHQLFRGECVNQAFTGLLQ